jgi:hypothetical protein
MEGTSDHLVDQMPGSDHSIRCRLVRGSLCLGRSAAQFKHFHANLAGYDESSGG